MLHNSCLLLLQLILCRGKKIVFSFFFEFCQISSFYSILYLILRFTKEETEVRKQALPFVPARYIRTFDVISEVKSRFTKEEGNFRLKVYCWPIEGGKYPGA